MVSSMAAANDRKYSASGFFLMRSRVVLKRPTMLVTAASSFPERKCRSCAEMRVETSTQSSCAGPRDGGGLGLLLLQHSLMAHLSEVDLQWPTRWPFAPARAGPDTPLHRTAAARPETAPPRDGSW